jgi:hypothetical protein
MEALVTSIQEIIRSKWSSRGEMVNLWWKELMLVSKPMTKVKGNAMVNMLGISTEHKLSFLMKR